MWDIKAGDRVVCVRDDFDWSILWKPEIGKTYTVSVVHGVLRHAGTMLKGVGIDLEEMLPHPRLCYPAAAFRKLPPRDLSAWLKTSVPNTDHLDKPLPAKKRERA